METHYLVSARKYRPLTFDTVVGQTTITRTLKNAIRTQQLAHAYLFCGPRGVGKTTCARIFAKTINCTQLGPNTEACNECDSCRTFQDNRSFNIHELDAASNNHVDDVRNLIDQVRIPPQVGKYSVYIIDEVHMLSQSAFNAFLKTLEEPPAHALFILATTEKHKIIPTILSRCQVYDFHRIQVRDAMQQLKEISLQEKVQVEEAALNIISQKADGSMRDALSIYDQVVSFCGSEITYQQVIEHLNVLDFEYYFNITASSLTGNYKSSLLLFDEILQKGFDIANFISGLSTHFRNLLVSKDKETLGLFEMSGELATRYVKEAQRFPIPFLMKGLKVLNDSEGSLRFSRDPRLSVELCLLNLASMMKEEASGEVIKKEVKKEVSDEAKPEPKPAIPQNSPVVQASPPPSGTRINDYLTKNGNKARGSEPSDVKGQAVNPSVSVVPEKITAEYVIEIWLEFAETQADQPRLYNLLTTQMPAVTDGDVVTLSLSSPLQEKAVKSVYNEILHHLRRRTGQDNLSFVIEMDHDEAPRKPYTQDEKYKHMQQKNPNIDLFRQSLNLDLE